MATESLKPPTTIPSRRGRSSAHIGGDAVVIDVANLYGSCGEEGIAEAGAALGIIEVAILFQATVSLRGDHGVRVVVIDGAHAVPGVVDVGVAHHEAFQIDSHPDGVAFHDHLRQLRNVMAWKEKKRKKIKKNHHSITLLNPFLNPNYTLICHTTITFQGPP